MSDPSVIRAEHRNPTAGRGAKRWLGPSVAIVLLAGCTSLFGEPPALETAIKRYYEAHASEEHGQCGAPYIDGLTKLDLVEDDARHTVVDARYLYGDRIKDQRSMTRGGGQRSCVGYGERRFVLTKSGDALSVTEMSGARRN
jgi:hypothetical protein